MAAKEKEPSTTDRETRPSGAFALRLSRLSARGVCLWAAALTAAVELLTVVLRFGFRLEAQKHSSWLAPLTLGFRIHHGYYGAVMLIAAALLSRRKAIRNALTIIGAALFLSDMIHHFLVLWPVTGSPEFYIRYGSP